MEEATNAHHRHLYRVDRTADPQGGVTGGNQREIDRARAQKRKEKQGVKQSDKDGLTAAQRKERDAKALQEKQARKKEAESKS